MPVRSALKTIGYALAGVAAVGLCLSIAYLLPAPWALVYTVLVAVLAVTATVFIVDMVAPGAELLSKAPAKIGSPSGRYVVLTFDDGPIEPFTSRVLDVLKAHGTRATFFCIGENARRHPEAIAAMARDGHDIENHSDTHALLPLQSDERIRQEITAAADTLEQLSGRRPKWLRCPKGYKSRRVQRIARELGQPLVGFSYPLFDTGDPDPNEVAERALSRAEPGDILLLHDGHAPQKPRRCDSAVQALPLILRGLRERGFEILSLTEALARDRAFAERSGLALPQPTEAAR